MDEPVHKMFIQKLKDGNYELRIDGVAVLTGTREEVKAAVIKFAVQHYGEEGPDEIRYSPGGLLNPERN